MKNFAKKIPSSIFSLNRYSKRAIAIINDVVLCILCTWSAFFIRLEEVILFNQKKLINERKKRGVFKVKPGITGLAQVSGITMKTPTLLSKTDLKMIKQMSLYYYFYYVLKTLL